MKKNIVLMCLFILYSNSFMAQETKRNLFDNINKIIKDNNKYYIVEKKPLELEFIVFDSISEKHNTKLKLASTTKYVIRKGSPVWFVIKDSLFLLREYDSEDKNTINRFGKRRVFYDFFDLNNFFDSKIKPIGEGSWFINSSLPVIREDVFLSTKFPRPEDAKAPYWDISHTWYDLIHTKNILTLFTSINDTTVIVKDIDLSSVPELSYSIRSQFYHIPNLKEFKVFRIKNDDYLVSSSGKIFFIPPKEKAAQYVKDRLGNEFPLQEDRVPIQIGYLQYEQEENLFYLVDNDKEEVFFNCPFVPLSKEYEGLIGYIDSKHWLYRQYNKIKKKYSEKK